MIPATRLLVLLAFMAGAALAITVWPRIETLWYGLAIVGALAISADALAVLRPRGIDVRRNVATSMPLNVWCDAALEVRNTGSGRISVAVFDHCPAQAWFRGLPQTVALEPGALASLRYELRPRQRGELIFEAVQIHIASPFKLWTRNRMLRCPSIVKVYPNFSVFTKYVLLATDNRLSQMGIRKRRRRGEGQDFHQLREYREGDALRQIDWKATARTRKLISREYQEERDQEVVFLIDCGKRMLAQDDALSHFDHTLNAVLLLAYVALRQGDAVGLGTFSGELRWLRPIKGVSAVNRILNAVYDLHPSTFAPDYSNAARQILARQRKRALVVIVTNVREEDSSDLLPALRILKRRHLVLLASMREQAIDNVLEKDVGDFDDALRLAATWEYLEQRQHAFEQIRASGVASLDVLPEELSVSLVNRYLDIKSSGML